MRAFYLHCLFLLLFQLVRERKEGGRENCDGDKTGKSGEKQVVSGDGFCSKINDLAKFRQKIPAFFALPTLQASKNRPAALPWSVALPRSPSTAAGRLVAGLSALQIGRQKGPARQIAWLESLPGAALRVVRPRWRRGRRARGQLVDLVSRPAPYHWLHDVLIPKCLGI